jgi:sec-independent protein translocase protein TatB
MFDIGFWEVALIGIVALLVVGPERLPGLAREVGRWVGKIRRYADHVKREIERDIRASELKQLTTKAPLRELEAAVDETKQILSEARNGLDSKATSGGTPSAGESTSATAAPEEAGMSKPAEGGIPEDKTEVSKAGPGPGSDETTRAPSGAPPGTSDTAETPTSLTSDDEQRRAAQ